jgi:hypothetical protein
MPWRPILFGGVVGYFLAVSTLPRDVLALFRQIGAAENKAAMGLIAAAILAVYCALIMLPLCFCANKERSTWKEIDASVRTSATANLRRRGSLGNLEFLGPALRTNLLANAVRFGGATSRDSRESPPPSARADDNDKFLASSSSGGSEAPSSQQEQVLNAEQQPQQPQQPHRRPRRSRLYSGDAGEGVSMGVM